MLSGSRDHNRTPLYALLTANIVSMIGNAVSSPVAAMLGAIRALLSPSSPFRIKPRLDIHLWSWLLAFARRCNARDMLSAARAIQPLLSSSMAEYERLLDGPDGLACEFEKRGLLFAYQTRNALDAYDETNHLLSEAFNEPAAKLDAAAACQLEPALKPEIAGAWFYEHDGHLRPDRLTSRWRLCRGCSLGCGKSASSVTIAPPRRCFASPIRRCCCR